LAVIVFVGYERGLLNLFELWILDQRFQLRGSIPLRAPIVLVSIDQDSFDELNLPWPWPRSLHAALIRKLSESHAKVIALDILFTEPKADPREDYELANAIKEAGNVILAAELTEVASDFGPKTNLNLPLPMLRDGALGYGAVNLVTDQDGVVRSAKPSLTFQDKVYPAFAYRIYQAAVASAKMPEPTALINYHGPAHTYPTVPYYRILRDEIDHDFFRDKIVLIGSFAPSLHDLYPTPFSASRPMAGVEIQANWIETMLAENPIIPVAGVSHAIIFFAVCALTIGFSLWTSPLKGFAAVSLLAGSTMVGCTHVFARYRIWFPMVPSLFGIALSYGSLTLNNYIRELKERIRLRAFLSKYVSADVAEEILANRAGLGLGGRRRHITVLFADVRGFTGISERISPELVVSFLSEYFAQVTQIVFKHEGTVDKFIGDGMMAMFGAPKSHGDDALRAVRTGLEMVELVETMGPRWAQILGQSVKIGIGINSGDAVVGSIGSEIRSDFTAIGDTVNLASRLEALTKEMGVPILISEFTAAEVKGGLPLTALQRVKVTGRETPLLVYTAAAYADGRVEPSALTSEPYIQRHK
jgi:adenylate cyclase